MSDLRQHGAPSDWRSIIATRYRGAPADLSRLVIADLTVFGNDASAICISGPRSTTRLAPLSLYRLLALSSRVSPKVRLLFPFGAGQFA